MSAREKTLFSAGHVIPDAEAAVRASKYASSGAGERAVFKMGYVDGASGEEPMRIINERWRPVYVAGHSAGVAALKRASGEADPVTDVQFDDDDADRFYARNPNAGPGAYRAHCDRANQYRRQE